MLRSALLAALLLAAALAGPARAQQIDYAERARDLTALSGVFGELHHIRRLCDARNEGEVWRNRMRRLVELEDPHTELRSAMVQAFNTGFRNAEARFSYCDRDARNYAAARAEEGEDLSARLAAPLYDSLAASGELPNVWGVEPGDVEADEYGRAERGD